MTTATSQSLKVLVTGPSTSLSTYLTKLATLQTKHSFDLILALDLFSNLSDDDAEVDDLINGTLKVPNVQIYVTAGSRGVLPKKIRHLVERGMEIVENLSFLGKTGILTLANGLRIATFVGAFEPELFDATKQDPDQELVEPLSCAHFTSQDITTFRSLLTPVQNTSSSLPSRPIPSPDILLTSALPSSLPLLSTQPLPPTNQVSSELDEIAKISKAKYHFVGGLGHFWEREPFQWDRTEGGGVCRAISLGEMGKKGSKERAFYAFSITPSGPPPNPLPTNLTPSPFSISSTNGPRGLKRAAGTLDNDKDGTNEYGVPNFIFSGGGQNGKHKRGRNGPNGEGGGERKPPPEHYTCNICQQKGHWIQDCPEKAERDAQRAASRGAPKRPIQPDECWFCLSNPKVTKHLIASIGSETYLTLPKGQLPQTGPNGSATENSPVPGGGHVLIIPIAHYPTLLSVPADQAVPIVAEIEQYKSGLRECYQSFDASPVAFEVGRLSGKGGHAHIQICPIPNSLVTKAEEVFVEEGKKVGIEFQQLATNSLDSLKKLGVTDNYFRVDLPNNKVLVHVIEQGKNFGLQFGRETLAVLIGLAERKNWKDCSLSEEEEKAECQAFKKAFKQFDPME